MPRGPSGVQERYKGQSNTQAGLGLAGEVGGVMSPTTAASALTEGATKKAASPMAQRILAWAQSHDWGKTARLSEDGKMLHDLLEESVDRAGNVTQKLVSMPTDLKKLRAWAGY